MQNYFNLLKNKRTGNRDSQEAIESQNERDKFE